VGVRLHFLIEQWDICADHGMEEFCEGQIFKSRGYSSL
jgi:hypothetical protein